MGAKQTSKCRRSRGTISESDWPHENVSKGAVEINKKKPFAAEEEDLSINSSPFVHV